ncbi:MAG: hypothetical protein JNJ45_04860 [Chthonomonas sp.]|nr:hypothetical protein [Chthonomonas sp.]
MKLTTIALSLALGLSTFAPAITQAHASQDMKPGMKQGSMAMMMTSSKFSGIEVNGGTVSASMNKGMITLTLSDDFKTPKSPAPHWQVVDSKGNVYLLKQLRIKDDMENRSIQLPSYIKSVAKVQIWCSYAEVNLGEAKFSKPMMAR